MEFRLSNASWGDVMTVDVGMTLIYSVAAVGIDYFGPLHVGTGPVTRSMKNPRPYKCYEYIFTGLRYRAVSTLKSSMICQQTAAPMLSHDLLGDEVHRKLFTATMAQTSEEQRRIS